MQITQKLSYGAVNFLLDFAKENWYMHKLDHANS